MQSYKIGKLCILILVASWFLKLDAYANYCSSFLTASATNSVKLNTDKDGNQYIVFSDLSSATQFLIRTHKQTRDNLEERLRLLYPAMNGLVQLLGKQSSATELTNRDKNVLSGAIDMWLQTISSDRYFQTDQLHDVIVKITGSNIFSPMANPVLLINFSHIYSLLRQSPPAQQLRSWLKHFKATVKKIEPSNLHHKALSMVPYLDLSAAERAELANAWIKQEAVIDDEWSDSMLELAFKNLYLIHPPSALKFYKRHRSKLQLIDLNNPEITIRAFAYLKYVYNENVPEFDIDILSFNFSPDSKFNPSKLEDSVYSWLKGLGLSLDRNVLDPVISSIELDFFLTINEARRLNIEVDGPHHFHVNASGQRFQRLEDIRRDEILNALGIETYRIPYSSLNDRSTAESEELKLIEFLVSD